MEILNIFNHYLERGGEAHAVDAICDSLSQVARIRRCDFLSADWAGPNAPALWQQAAWMIRNPRSLRTLRDFQAAGKPDVWLIHNVFPVGSAAIYAEAKRRGIPVIQYLHNFRPFSVNGYLWAGDSLAPGGLSGNYWQEIRSGAWQGSRIKTAWLAFVLTLSQTLGWWTGVKAWIAISEFMREKFILAGIPTGDIFTLKHFWKPQATPTTSSGSHYLFLGRLITAKGIDVLLDAWEILENESAEKTPRLVVGGDGPLRLAVASRTERMRSVTFVGELSGQKKMEALQHARAVVIPSIWWEGLGLVAYEAYEYARPVLAARSGGLSEVVVDGQTGLLHEPGNARELAAQVRKLEQENKLRQEMGAEGRLWLERHANEADWQRRFFEIAEYAVRSTG